MANTNEPPYVSSGRPDFSPGGNRAGWHEPKPSTTLQPTFWPAVMAIAIAGMMAGIILDYFVLGAAAGLFAVACAGWIGDLLREK